MDLSSMLLVRSEPKIPMDSSGVDRCGSIPIITGAPFAVNENSPKNTEQKIRTEMEETILWFIAISYFLFPISSSAAVQEEIAERQRQIEAIEKEIAGLQQQIAETQGQARTLQNEVNVLNAQIRQIELGIRSLELSIGETSFEIGTTRENIQDIEEKVSKHKEALGQFIKLIDHSDNKSLTEVLLSYDDLSDFFNALNDIKTNQENLQATITKMKTLKIELETYQTTLEEKLAELDRARKIEALS